jgi:membrane peptidoglycan carboxypeptidase
MVPDDDDQREAPPVEPERASQPEPDPEPEAVKDPEPAKVPVPVTASSTKPEPAKEPAAGVPDLAPSLVDAKRARRRRRLTISLVAILLVIGLGVGVGVYLIASVPTPDELTFPETTILYYNDGTELARLGEVTRFEVAYQDISDHVTHAIVASEDKTFWTNSGIDVARIIGAAWNNATGDDHEGGATLTEQYARIIYDLRGDSASRRFNEAVLASRLDGKYSKEKILELYLNAVPLGRQTYGFEAAAQAYFGKSIKKSARPQDQITLAQAMALVPMVKQPNPDPADPRGRPGYDATLSPQAEKQSRDRWEYVRAQLLDLEYITPEQSSSLQYPPLEEWRKDNPARTNGVEKPAGLVVNHVLSELNRSTGPFAGKSWKEIREGGYKIYTTLHPGAQQAAENAANEQIEGSVMHGQPPTLQAAMVAVEPGTGRILAYYGGMDGKGADYAGFYVDDSNQASGFGAHPPGSSFMLYTLAAALKNNISLNSYWRSAPHDTPGRTGPLQIQNTGTCFAQPAGYTGPCSLLNATIASLNTVFVDVALSTSPKAVLELAKAAGIDSVWSPECKGRVSLRDTPDMATVIPRCFDYTLAIGQYAVTVQDQANAAATMAAGGLRADAHFVAKVMDGDRAVYTERLPAAGQARIFNEQAANDLTFALSRSDASNIPGLGWDTAGKPGSWEYGGRTTSNAHAWMVGFDKNLAAAVWIGSKKEETAIKDKAGRDIYGAGLPAQVWKAFMTAATRAIDPPKENTKFNPPTFGGNTNPPGSVPAS